MEPTALDFFKRILATPSPSGYESAVQQVVRDYVAEFADEVRTDLHGNVIAVRNPAAPLRVMLAGHCDQIGLIVQHIDDEGFLYVQPIGGWDPRGAHRPADDRLDRRRAGARRDCPQADPPAHRRRAQAGAEDQGPVAGHRRQRQGRRRASRSASATRSRWSFSTASFATAWRSPRPWTTRRACGSWSRPSAASMPASCAWAVYAVSTVQEELGLRGARTSAFGIDPHVGVAVDVTHATDCPTVEKKEEGDVAPGQGAGRSIAART